MNRNIKIIVGCVCVALIAVATFLSGQFSNLAMVFTAFNGLVSAVMAVLGITKTAE